MNSSNVVPIHNGPNWQPNIEDINGWPEPDAVTITVEPEPLPDVTTNTPGVFGEMIAAVAESIQVPPDLPFMVGLAAVGVAGGGQWRIHVGGDWYEQMSLYTMALLPSGSRKSPALAAMSKAIHDLESDLRDEAKVTVATTRTQKEVLAERIKHLKGQLGRGADTEKQADLEDAVAQDALLNEEHLPDLLVDDVGPEALGVVMQRNNERAGILADEGGVLGNLAGRHNRGVANLDLVLRSYDGKPVKVNRISRESLHLRQPCLNIALAFQPDIFARYRGNDDFRDSGFLARFLYSVPKSLVGHEDLDAAAIPGHVRDAYEKRVYTIGQTSRSRSSGFTPALPLTAGAQARLRAFREDLRPRMREDGDLRHLNEWAAKLAGQLVRIAAVFALVDAQDPGRVRAVEERYVLQALVFSEYLIRHADLALSLGSSLANRSKAATELLDWLRQRPADKRVEFAVRDAYRSLNRRSWASESIGVVLAADELAEAGWLRQVDVEGDRSKGGRRASPRFEINPRLYQA